MLTREGKKKNEENKSVQQTNKKEKNTDGKNRKENPLCVRSKSLGTKNDLSYSRSSDLRIDAGRVKKKAKKCIKVKQINKRREKKNKDTFFLLLHFTKPVPDE
jgi:hypothetical protein